MRSVQSNKLDFRGQNIYVGIDVHKKSWAVSVLSENAVLKKFSQAPQPEALHKFLVTNYPRASYRSVYEAGFCGFWIHHRLTELGIGNIVVNPADVPTKSSEKLRKTDAVDSIKLARSLRAGELKGIYTPDSETLEMRSLIRLKKLDRKRHHAGKEPHQVTVAFPRSTDAERIRQPLFSLVKTICTMAKRINPLYGVWT